MAEPYEVRYGWTNGVRVMLASSAFLMFVSLDVVRGDIASGDLPILGLHLLGPVIGLSGLCTALATGLSRKAALRIDAEGVLLGGAPLRRKDAGKLVPWGEIARIELRVQPTADAWRKTLRIGLHPVTEPAGPAAWHRDLASLRFDTVRLLTAARAFAPGMAIDADPDFPDIRKFVVSPGAHG